MSTRDEPVTQSPSDTDDDPIAVAEPSAAESDSHRTEYKRKRGELRIYLGSAPGVGKTYAMLGEAHRRLERGTDLVAAVVETHGRKKTADLLDGIETSRRSTSSIAAARSPNSTSRQC